MTFFRPPAASVFIYIYPIFLLPRTSSVKWKLHNHSTRSRSLENVLPRYCTLQLKQKILTLIRAAGGVYDFQNFEEVYLCNGLRSELQNSFIPQKTSREYILLSTLERKMPFSAIYRPIRAQNRPFFRRFWLFCTAVKVYMTSMNLSTITPRPGTPPANSRHAKQFWSPPHGL